MSIFRINGFAFRSFCLLAIAMLFIYGKGGAQLFSKQKYPQNYFQWPINAKIALAANFGELRPNHYHMGLDCKSDQMINKDIYAAAEGYIAKIKVEPFGFGQAIYINHPNGLTTLYAHLNSFYPLLNEYVKTMQYNLKSWAVFLDIPPNLFPVKKGEFIAKSGNTGGSQGPHLHFEVRDTKTDKVLNPLLMGFPIADNIAPDVVRIAVYDRCLSTYEQSPKIYSLKKTNGVYSVAGGSILVNSEKVSFAITAWDRYTGSTNQNGIYQAIVYDNDNPISGFRIDSISYDQTRYMNACVDYKTKATGGPWLQHLSKLLGDNTGVHVTDKSNGVITLEANVPHQIKIEVSDANGNTSTVKFVLNMKTIIEKNDNDVSNKVKQFHPKFLNIFDNGKVKFYLPENALYDSFSFKYKETLAANNDNNIYQLHSPIVPVQTYFPISIKANFDIADTGKIVMKKYYGAKSDYAKAIYKDGWYTAKFREFGNFQLMLDKSPPLISTNGFVNGINAYALKRIVFSVSDNAEDLASFNLYLDDEWTLCSNDKGRNYIYTFDEKCSKGNHQLRAVAIDLVGNVTERTYNFTR